MITQTSGIRKVTHIDNIKLSNDKKAVIILDQSKLPNETVYLRLESLEEFIDALLLLKVRGAPAIGIFAGYCMFVMAQQIAEGFGLMKNPNMPVDPNNWEKFYIELSKRGKALNDSRPTAVNLSKMIKRMLKMVERTHRNDESMTGALIAMYEECINIHNEDIRMCRAIAQNGLSLLQNGDGILTHCNAGPLATSRYGTALGPIFLGAEQGFNFHVYADETRPLFQGARITSYELFNGGIDVTLICDNMAATVMKHHWVNAIFVGCDRVAANGDTANKIGTSGLAIMAKYYGIPFYVLGPTSSIDLDCYDGMDITIEERDPEEIKTKFFKEPIAPRGVKCFNPAFDVTDNTLINAIITEKGICYPPYRESLGGLFKIDANGDLIGEDSLTATESSTTRRRVTMKSVFK